METKLKATPGPWELHESGAIVGPKIDDKPIWLRPVIARFETGVKREDALLLASAPDLYAALEAMLEVHGVTQEYADKHIEIPQSWVEASEIALAALAKARGEQ